MKVALITEEQIKAIEDALMAGRSTMLGKLPNNAIDTTVKALAAVKSLKVQAPVAYGYKDKHGDIADCLRNKHTDDEFPYDVPLYAGEQA